MGEQLNQEVNARLPEYAIHPLFIERWSPRAFSEDTVSDEVLLSILEAARWAPSASNIQPWRFIVARTAEQKALFYSFIAVGNRVWCEKAPVLVLLLSHTLANNGQLNTSHAFDAGTAWGYLALEATNQGLRAHAMAGFDAQLARKELHVPEEYTLHVVIALGYQGDKTQLPENLQQRETPNMRRPIEESIYSGNLNQPFNV